MSTNVHCRNESTRRPRTGNNTGGSSAEDGRRDRVFLSHERGHIVVIEPLGQLDGFGVEQVRTAVQAARGRPVIIDLRDCILTQPEGLAGMDADADLCFVSRRLTCRLLLDRTGISARYAVFRQLEDALQARAFADAGYGCGWRVPTTSDGPA